MCVVKLMVKFTTQLVNFTTHVVNLLLCVVTARTVKFTTLCSKLYYYYFFLSVKGFMDLKR